MGLLHAALGVSVRRTPLVGIPMWEETWCEHRSDGDGWADVRAMTGQWSGYGVVVGTVERYLGPTLRDAQVALRMLTADGAKRIREARAARADGGAS